MSCVRTRSGEEKAMVSRRKRVTARKAKSKAAKGRGKTRKKLVKRALAKKSKKAAKRVATKARRSRRVSERTAVGRQKQPRSPTVEDTVIDVIDEPAPGVVRVTEIEELRVGAPDADEDNDD